MDKVRFRERLKNLMEEKNLRQKDVIKMSEGKISKSDISYYLLGKVCPTSLKVKALANALGVKETELTGDLDDSDYLKSEEEREFVKVFRNLKTFKSKVELLHFLYELEKSEKNK